jgi:hypothetical protein
MSLDRKVWAGTVEVKDAARGEAVAVFASLDEVDHDGDFYAFDALRPSSNVPLSPWNHSSSTVCGSLPVGKASQATPPAAWRRADPLG